MTVITRTCYNCKHHKAVPAGPNQSAYSYCNLGEVFHPHAANCNKHTFYDGFITGRPVPAQQEVKFVPKEAPESFVYREGTDICIKYALLP